MAIDVGDAVLRFLADTTQLDEAYTRVSTEGVAKMGQATASVKGVTAAVSDLSKEMAVGQQGAVKLGDVMQLNGEKAKFSMYEARGEAGLLGEAFGIHLPRHVRSFIAELPGVGTALSAAFGATAVLFIIEAVVKLIEKMKAMAEQGEEIAKAWDGVEKAEQKTFDTLDAEILKAEIKFDELTGQHVEALRLKLKEIDNTSLSKLSGELEKFGTSADLVFEKMDRGWFSKNLLGLPGAEEAKKLFDTLGESVDKALSTKTPKAFDEALAVVNADATKAAAELKKLQDEQTAFDNARRNIPGHLQDEIAPPPDPVAIEAWQKLTERIDAYRTAIEKSQKANTDAKKDTSVEDNAKALDRATAEAKRNYESQIATIEEWKASVHAAYASGTKSAADWKVAEEQAATASGIAHEDYLNKVVAIYAKSANPLKEQIALEELNTLKTKDAAKETESAAVALEKYHVATRKIVDDHLKLTELNIDKAWQAQAQAIAIVGAAEESIRIKVDETTKSYTEQEKAVSQLATFGLITEEQKAQRLRTIYAKEEADVRELLQQIAKLQEDEVNRQQARLSAAQDNPFISQQQIDQMKKSLDAAKTTYERTQKEILDSDAKFYQQQLSLQRGAVAQSVAIALASGHQQLAVDLQQHQAKLDLINDEIRQAKVRGDNTAALQRERTATEAETKALIDQTRRLKEVNAAVVELSKTMRQAATDELNAFGTAMAAAISGQQTFGAAMEAETLRVISSIAQHWADYYFAMAIAEYASQDYTAAAGHTAAAIAFEAVAGITAGLASSIQSNSSGSGGNSTSSAPSSPAQTAGAPPPNTVNTPHLAGGGMVNQRMVAVVGDSRSGGNAREGILPLDNPVAMRSIAGAIAEHMGTGLGQTVIHEHHYHIKGDVIDHGQLMKRISREVKRGTSRLEASNSSRITKKA